MKKNEVWYDKKPNETYEEYLLRRKGLRRADFCRGDSPYPSWHDSLAYAKLTTMTLQKVQSMTALEFRDWALNNPQDFTALGYATQLVEEVHHYAFNKLHGLNGWSIEEGAVALHKIFTTRPNYYPTVLGGYDVEDFMEVEYMTWKPVK